jgi:hypothetical protein
VTELLKLTHLLHQNGVAEVKIRARRIEAGFDPELLLRFEALEELGADVEIDHAPAQGFELFFRRGHGLGDLARLNRRRRRRR